MIRDLLFYGAGVPRFVFIWLLVTPAMIWLARAAGLRGRRLALLVVTTLPTFGLHFAAVPGLTSFPVRWAVTVVSLSAMVVLLVGVVRNGLREAVPPREWTRRCVPVVPAVLLLVAAAVAIRAVWAWVDPGIADIPQASEYAARQVLAGVNPYVDANPYTYAPVYQYPAGTILWHLPFVALVPDSAVLGESFMAARVAAWAMDALAVGLLGVGGWVASNREPTVPILALLPAALYGLNATLVREVGLTGANDVLMGVLSALAVGLLADDRQHTLAAVCMGLAVAVKPPALVLLPIVAVVAGLRRGLLAVAVTGGMQLPFLLWPSPGLHGLGAILEPALRNDSFDVVRSSVWWPAYVVGGWGRLASVLSHVPVLAGLVVSGAGAAWIVRASTRRPSTQVGVRLMAIAAVALAVLVLLAPGWRTTFQSWPIPATIAVASMALWQVSTTAGQRQTSERVTS